MARMWKHRTLTDAADLPPSPLPMPGEQAQQWCNFVVWMPTDIPAGCILHMGTLRQEAPPGRVGDHTAGRTPWSANNPAAYRFEITGPHRRLRVKQFLYDWAFPALDHPSLWESAAQAAALDDEHVVWLGIDYQKNKAASARLDRTTVELSVLEGEFSEQEIIALYRAMRPALPEARSELAHTPFSALSYWARRPEATNVDVPIGMWTFRRRRSHTSQWHTNVEAQELVNTLGFPSTIGGLNLECAAQFTDDEGRIEIEALYFGGSHQHHELRLIAQNRGEGSLHVPAAPEDQPGQRELLHVRSSAVQLAWVDEHFGPFHAVYARGTVQATLLSSTGVGLDRTWFLEALRETMT
ncbi:MAG: hypothetical protein HOQ05_04420 [Corynebacteriales bacterium]|nr:hypothetical protein [Mycobacteriales bacterium]